MQKNEDKKKSVNGELPLVVKIIYIATAISIFVAVAYIISEPFADFFNRYISSVLRALLAWISNAVPFSIAEFVIILLPMLLVAAAIFASRRYSDSWRDVFVGCVSMLSLLALVLSVFLVGFAPGYHTTSLDKKLGTPRREVSDEELYETAEFLRERAEREAEEIVFQRGGFSVMPYTLKDMEEKLIEAYAVASYKYPFLQRLDSRLKPVMLSEAMSYTHVTGVYSFFTGEANINIDFPDYTIPYTAAHELAHQRGIAREDEANFVAYLVCIESNDPYIRYSAYMNLYEYVLNALWRADPELYKLSVGAMKKSLRGEMVAYSDFFEKYRDSVASEVSGVVNDTFLTIQGTEGSASYGMVVDLAVAYYKDK